jgi:hypothetical protein
MIRWVTASITAVVGTKRLGVTGSMCIGVSGE